VGGCNGGTKGVYKRDQVAIRKRIPEVHSSGKDKESDVVKGVIKKHAQNRKEQIPFVKQWENFKDLFAHSPF
jgi:hypothetical protein